MDWRRLWKDTDDLSARLSRLFFITTFGVGFKKLYESAVAKSDEAGPLLIWTARVAFLLTVVLAFLQLLSVISVFWPRKEEAFSDGWLGQIGGIILTLILAFSVCAWAVLVFALLQTGLLPHFMGAQ